MVNGYRSMRWRNGVLEDRERCESKNRSYGMDIIERERERDRGRDCQSMHSASERMQMEMAIDL